MEELTFEVWTFITTKLWTVYSSVVELLTFNW